MVHAQTTDVGESAAKPAAAKTAQKTRKTNPLFDAVKRELSKLKGKKKTTRQKTTKTTQQKTTKSKTGLLPMFNRSKSKTAATSPFRRSKSSAAPTKTRQPIQQVAANQPLPSLEKKTTTRTRKPGLLDRLFGRNKSRTRPRRVTAQQNVPKKSNGIPGLLPSFLRPKSKQQATARRLPTQQRTAGKLPVVNRTAAAAPKLDDLDNAFPELTEAEADKTGDNLFDELTEAKPEPKEENPFTGIKLEEPVVQSSGTGEEQPVITANSAEEPKTEPEENPHEDKLKRLAERDAMGGLKGFCPVALRDHRDLVDADTDITSTYQDKAYSFSTVEAKDSFEADPAKYAPIHSGHDVIVLTEGNVELEGTLENAVWFKDRLYLFSSAATLETFVGNPTKYAAISPEESTQADTDTADDSDPFADLDSQDSETPDPFADMEVELPTIDDEDSADDK
jgi:YHS domain-containing protein